MTVVPPGTETGIALPEGWAVTPGATPLTIVGPENDIRIEFVEMARSGEVHDLALAAWRTLDPEFNLPIQQQTRAPAEDGWESHTQIVYQTPAAQGRAAVAIVRTLGGRAYINLVTGTKAAFSRRMAQLGQIVEGWKPQGLTSTNLADRERTVWGEAQSRELNEFVRAAMEQMRIPGVSIAIVESGRVAYAQGFGTTRVGSQEAVSPGTAFMIGSATKALTTLMMARLVERGDFRWETPVIDVLEGFALADPGLTRKLQMRHTVCACTGMPRRDLDFIFKYAGITPEQRMAEMRTMKPTTGFGETFQYSNYLVAAGGYAAAHAFAPEESLESAYERAMQDLVFQPLEMSSTVLRQDDALRQKHAYPHGLDFEGQCREIPLDMEGAVYSVAPAGAAWSTATDLAQYLLLELMDGRTPAGQEVLSTAALKRRRNPEIKIVEKASYGLGLFLSEEQGIPTIGHGGNTLGFSADMYFLPTKDLGVVVLTNLYFANFFLGAVRQKVFEILFGATPKAEEMIADAIVSRDDKVAKMRARVSTDAPAIALLEATVGGYASQELGPARIENRNGEYRIEFESWGSALAVEAEANGDQLLVITSPPLSGALRFQVAPDRQALILDAGQMKYTFVKL